MLLSEQLTKINEYDQKKLLRFFIKANENIKLEIMNNQRSIFFNLKKEFEESLFENSVLTYASIILAVKKYNEKITEIDKNLINKKFKSMNITKSQKLLSYYPLLIELKKKGLSYKKISKYLLTYHKFDVSYSTIFKLLRKQNDNN